MRKVALFLLLLLVTALGQAQSGVRAVTLVDNVNVRVSPALGADVVATVPAGYVFEFITARSADSQWLRVDFNGQEAWVGVAPLTILSGDVTLLPVADPRSIPYGGFESPRSGASNATSIYRVRITNGLRMRAGPSQAYPTLANIFANTDVPVFGRTASNGWVQVLYQGLLGWVSSSFVMPLDGLAIPSLPIDGIVAESPPILDSAGSGYLDTLRLMRARLDLAQPSLDAVRGIWADAAFNGRVSCHSYPAQPSDLPIAVPVLASAYTVLFPLQTDFNNAMSNLRGAIDLLIQTCNQPGTGNPVGQATVIGALSVINTVDGQFADLRARLNALIPPDIEAGPGQCVFTFQGRAAILPVIGLGQVVRQPFNPAARTFGYCIDLTAGMNITAQTLTFKGNVAPILTLSPIDNPTNFLGIARAGQSFSLVLFSNVTIPTTGRYLVIVSHVGASSTEAEEPVNGELALLVVDLPPLGVAPALQYDAATDTVTIVFGGFTLTPSPQATNSNQAQPLASCPSLAFTCNDLFTCSEAYACYNAGNRSLDPDGNGIPCDALCQP